MATLRKRRTAGKVRAKVRAGVQKMRSAVRARSTRRVAKQPVTRPIHDHD